MMIPTYVLITTAALSDVIHLPAFLPAAIMVSCEITPKAQLMATYYQKLARIFWVSENYLFHAYAYYKFFALSVSANKALSDADKSNMAAAVVLAALAIPVYSTGAPGSSAAPTNSPLDVDSERDKKSKLAALLKHSSMPSRDALLAELVAKGALKMVPEDVRRLFSIAQREFAPLKLISEARPILDRLRKATGPVVTSTGTLGGGSTAASNSLSQYVPNLERLLVLRTLQQLSGVYSTLKLEVFEGLCSGLATLTPLDVQKLIARAVKNGQLAVRIDHRAGILRMGSEAVETAAMRRQLTELAARLHAVVEAIAPSSASGEPTLTYTAAKKRAAVFEAAGRAMEEAPAKAAARGEEIELRKETAERRRQIMERRVSSARSSAETPCCVQWLLSPVLTWLVWSGKKQRWLFGYFISRPIRMPTSDLRTSCDSEQQSSCLSGGGAFNVCCCIN